MIVVVYLSFVSIDIIDVNLLYFCGFHNAREIRESLANFFRDLMKDKLVAGGVSGRDPADDDDDYRIQSKLRDTLV